MLIQELLSKFDTNNYKIKSKSDTLGNSNLTFEIDSLPELNVFYEIEELLKEYPKRDLFDICIKSSGEDFFNIKIQNGALQYSGPHYIVKNNNINEILEKFNELRGKEYQLEVKIKIEKNYENGFISIYLLDDFIKWILSKNTYETIKLFSNIYKNVNYPVFISYDKEIKIVTETFQIAREEELIKEYFVNRENILKTKLDITNIQKMELNLIPNDFNIKKYEYKNTKLKNRLNSIRDILSIIYISDISLIGDKFLEFRINGYKRLEFKIFYEEIQNKEDNNKLYDIYKWIYNDGNLIDKSTIARNIISLHCRHQSILELDNESLSSIKTNYTYYLKTNTDDFLEEKKNLRLSIIEEGKLLSEALDELIGSMGKNLLAYFTFLATLIVSNTLTQENFKNIFTFEVVQIIAIIILGSFLFLIYSNIKTCCKRKRIQDYMDDLVEGYGVLLGEENATGIINNVKSYNNIVKSFNCRQFIISILWVAFNILLLVFLDWISGDIKIFGIINFLNCR